MLHHETLNDPGEFAAALEAVLPADLPRRESLIGGAATHLRLIAEANEYMNLTRIVSPREAAIKHVLDSVLPWRLFEQAQSVLDAGTGAGFPGIPLALMFPQIRFTLADSTGKKARFVQSVASALDLKNVTVSSKRVEDLCRSDRPDLIAARAFAPVGRCAVWFAPALRKGSAALLYKGPDAVKEIAEAHADLAKLRLAALPVIEYDLPDGMGSRTLVRLQSGGNRS